MMKNRGDIGDNRRAARKAKYHEKSQHGVAGGGNGKNSGAARDGSGGVA